MHVAVYAKNIHDVIGYNISFGYDSTAVTFTGVSEGTEAEVNLLKKSGGLSVTLPPIVSENTIEYAGAILGSNSAQTVTGDGLLGIFKFKTKNDFLSPADFLVARVLIQSSTSADTLGTLARATVELASQRILLALAASSDTIKADGVTSTRLTVDLKDADGNSVTEESTVRFEVVSGEAELSSTEVVTGSSQAEVDLVGTVAGTVTVQVSVGGATAERILIYLEESAPIGSGPLGQIALDLDPASGDQQSRTRQSLTSGEDIIIDIVVVDDIVSGMSGFEFVLLFDNELLSFTGFNAADVFAGAAPIVGASGDTVTVSSVLLGTVASEASGTIGQATFQLREGATRDATISILRAQLGGPDGRLPLVLGTGGSIVQLGTGSQALTPDFDGDGTVGFTDFIAFAGVFGAASGSSNFDPRFDLDATGDIGFGDFLLFAQAFGSSTKRAAKRSSAPPTNLRLLTTVEDLGKGYQVIHLTVAEGQNAQAYGLSLDFDPSVVTVEDVSTRFSSSLTLGSASPAISLTDEIGRVTVADFGATDGDLVSVTVRSSIGASLGLAGINLVDLSGHVTRLPDRSVALSDVTKTVSIGQNFPNPFNPETVIPFSLPESGVTRLSIYNLVGQEIAVLIDDHMAAGNHTVRWSGRDDLGRIASTGIYFVRMVAGPEQRVRKIVLMK